MIPDRPTPAERVEGRHSPDTRSFLYTNYAAAGVVVALSAITYLLSLQIERVPPALAQGIQPTSFPRGVIIAILAFTALMLFDTRNTPMERPEPVPGLAYKTMAAMIAALAISTTVDFFAGLFVFLAICAPMWGARRWGFVFAYALVVQAVLFLLFSTFLQVRFPHGLLSRLFY